MLARAQVEPSSPPPTIPSPVSVSWPRPGYGNKAFTGREWDPEAQLYYYRARYYDPRQARFVSEDPTRFEGGMNFFTYAANRPTIAVDPLGLEAQVGFPVEICAGLKKGSVCCRGGRFTVCLPGGMMDGAFILCLIYHETYHAEQIACWHDGCADPPCTPVKTDKANLRECRAWWIQYDCLKKHDRARAAEWVKGQAQKQYGCRQEKEPWAGNPAKPGT